VCAVHAVMLGGESPLSRCAWSRRTREAPRRHREVGSERRPPPSGAVRLPPESARRVQQDIFALVAGDRVARGLMVSALAVAPTALQLVIAAPENVLWPGLGRLKSKLARRRNTWGRGFWYARLLDEPAQRAIEVFVLSCGTRSRPCIRVG
jgi:hypothetical protein